MTPELAARLVKLPHARATLNEWQRVFREQYEIVRPLLTRVPGDFSSSYYHENGQVLRVRQYKPNKFVAHTVGNHCKPMDDVMDLTWDDVSFWRLSDKALQELESIADGRTSPTRKDNVARVIGEFERIILPSGKIMTLVKKHKRRQFLRLAHQHCRREKTETFDWQQVLISYNEQFKDPSEKSKRILTDRVEDDLFKGQQAEFLDIFAHADRANRILRLKVCFEFLKT